MSYPNNAAPDPEIIQRAAALIRSGKLVAFPTETVYGLGANALDAGAVQKIFRVKGRPASSPLIVHVHSLEAARDLVIHWPPAAEKLAREFWPGPLTIVLAKREFIPDIVTASLPTVGVRVPANVIALALLAEARVPIAAPSANHFSELSPTTAQHVRNSLGDAVDLILDGGRTDVGIESTVLSLAGPIPVLFRPGMISTERIEQLIGKIEVAKLIPDGPHPAPGMHERHYSPRTPLMLHLPASDRGAYLWMTCPHPGACNVEMPADAAAYAAVLYDTLHRLDAQGLDWIAIEPPPEDAVWSGVNDRLRRAKSHF